MKAWMLPLAGVLMLGACDNGVDDAANDGTRVDAPADAMRVNTPNDAMRVNTPNDAMRVNTPNDAMRVNTPNDATRMNTPLDPAARPNAGVNSLSDATGVNSNTGTTGVTTDTNTPGVNTLNEGTRVTTPTDTMGMGSAADATRTDALNDTGRALSQTDVSRMDRSGDAARTGSSDTPPPAVGKPQDYAPHSAMNSLDYQGTYTWEPEVGASQGAKETLVLKPGGMFTMTRTGAPTSGDVPREDLSSGRYVWDVTGTVLTLTQDGKDMAKFFVGENYLKRVDSGEREGQTFRKVNGPQD